MDSFSALYAVKVDARRSRTKSSCPGDDERNGKGGGRLLQVGGGYIVLEMLMRGSYVVEGGSRLV